MNRYFEGWYFKQQTQEGTLALIPAMHLDEAGNAAASIQIVTEDAAFNCPIPRDSFFADRHHLLIKAGKSIFSESGIRLDVQTGNCLAQGHLYFGPLSHIQSDIMGPFRFAPFMECRHSIFSMAHEVKGTVSVNGKEYLFHHALGYIEGDRGRSFPKDYAWTQCVWRDELPCSIMLSAAEIPYLGIRFTGVIGAVLYNGHEYRLATYLGAKAEQIENGEIFVRQKNYTLMAKRLDKGEIPLHAPVLGNMTRMIREAPSCRVHYSFKDNDETLIDLIADHAGFEFEYGR